MVTDELSTPASKKDLQDCLKMIEEFRLRIKLEQVSRNAQKTTIDTKFNERMQRFKKAVDASFAKLRLKLGLPSLHSRAHIF